MKTEIIKVYGVKFVNKYSGFYEGKEYYYLNDGKHKVGDIVVVDTKYGAGVAQISSEAETKSVHDYKEILVNITDQHSRFTTMAKSYRDKANKARMEEIIQSMREQERLAFYVDKNEEFAALYKEVYGE